MEDVMFSDLIYDRALISMSHYMARTERVSAVVIHYTASIVKEASEVVRYWEQNDRYSSSNYIIDVMGRITGVVPEELRPFTTGSFGKGKDDIDNRAITIECSCDSSSYTVSGATIDALCKLMGDIGSRYGIWWRFTGDKSGNVHAHKWYQATPCPGEYLYSKFPLITDMANYIIYKKEEMNVSEIEDRLSVLEGHTLPTMETLEDVPEWGKEEIAWLIRNGFLKGDDKGLGLSYDMLRGLVIGTRAIRDRL